MLRSILGGAGLGLLAFFLACGVVAACGTPTLVQCRLQAIAILPADPEDISVGVARELQRRVKACEVTGDAGL